VHGRRREGRKAHILTQPPLPDSTFLEPVVSIVGVSTFVRMSVGVLMEETGGGGM
jgi:hypothetical protein